MRKQHGCRELADRLLLQVRDRLLLLPIIGVIDTHRARLITDGFLRSIRDTRAKVVAMDVTGVATIDTKVANHLIQTVTAARLMGARVIVTGLPARSWWGSSPSVRPIRLLKKSPSPPRQRGRGPG